MNKEFDAKIKLLIKSEKALLNLELRKKSRQTILVAVALLSVLIALGLLNLTVYLYLNTDFTPLISAAILTGLNLLVALIFFMMASRQNLGAEAESIREIRDFAWGQVSDDISEVKQDVVDFRESVYRVKNRVDSVVNKDLFGFKGVLPIIQTLLEIRGGKK